MTEITRYTNYLNIDLSDLLKQTCFIGASKKWGTGSSPYAGCGKHIAVPVVAGETYVLQMITDAASSSYFAYLSSSYNPPYSNNNAMPYATGYDRISISMEPVTITIPEGCSYLAMTVLNSTNVDIDWTLKKVETENAPYTVNGMKCFLVTDEWDGGIDAGGILIEDVFDLDNILITGNDSAKQLSLLAQVINIKSQRRAIKPVIEIECDDYTIEDVDITIEDIHISKVYKCMGRYTVSKCMVGRGVPSNNVVHVELTADQVRSISTMFPTVPDCTINTTPIPYDEYGIFIDGGAIVDKTEFLGRLFYKDSNDDDCLFGNFFGGFNLEIITCSELLTEGILVTSYIEDVASHYGYKIMDYIQGPGNSIIVTDLIPNERSRMEATIQFVTDSSNPLYPRLICAGKDNTSLSFSSSYESYYYGTLHVSYGNNTSWNTYSDVTGDLGKHTYAFDHNAFYKDGLLIGRGAGTFTAESYFSVFGEANRRNNNCEQAGKLYHMAFYQDGVLIADMYPAVNSINQAGMYDIIRHMFFVPSDASYVAY